MRISLTIFAAFSTLLIAGPAFAQTKPLPASEVVPPVELAISMENGKPVCAPAELLLPADTNVSISIVSTADTPVTITAAGQFENGHVLHADGDLTHDASEKGYTIKRNGKGVLKVRTMKAGESAYGCTSNRNADAPFVGKLILSPPAG
ncbi:cupredoxin domain-containing protein [Methylobacterium sp. E-025]|uniref:cupredoxin domain-containing protein n=1 Tax=Methylobacterium sp. E-025 TaxID=2836561 RepID=UPI001FBAFFFB|nr:cupredoxin domain-containing protein [Methylobacterium sp. E-025]MCJ2114705.1 cupredoxin domain-containing protein [Methylobacterium sp. E-025]